MDVHGQASHNQLIGGPDGGRWSPDASLTAAQCFRYPIPVRLIMIIFSGNDDLRLNVRFLEPPVESDYTKLVKT